MKDKQVRIEALLRIHSKHFNPTYKETVSQTLSLKFKLKKYMLQFLLYNTYATSNISTKPLPVQNDISVSLHQTQGEEQVKVLR